MFPIPQKKKRVECVYQKYDNFLGSYLSISAVIKSYLRNFFPGEFRYCVLDFSWREMFWEEGNNICSGELRNCSTSLIFFGRSMVLCG